MAAHDRRRLGDILVDAGMLTKEEVEKTVAEKGDEKLGDALKNRGLITEEELLELLEFQLSIPRIRLNTFPVDTEAVKHVSRAFAERNDLIPVEKSGTTLRVAMADPIDYFALDDIRMSSGFEVDPVIASKMEIREAVAAYYADWEEAAFQVSEAETSSSMTQIGDREEDAPVIRMVNQMLIKGLQKEASDIHVDPQEDKVLFRYRIDGVLHSERAMSREYQNALTARIKIMAELNITETRLPQDGRVKVHVEQKQVDLRISTMPTIFGEKIVIRILDKEGALKEIEDLGFNSMNLKKFRKLIERPSGMILITGPTGSGKTTTLYAALNRLNGEEVNIITAEDPVEYQIEGINQVQVKPEIGLTFAHTLRTILRQDPDIVMVGEVRDSETAEIAIRAALTGHLVFSTIHTNSAVATIPRLIDMGIEPYLVTSSVSGIISQRLVREICSNCRTSDVPTEAVKEIFEARGMDVEAVYYGSGCEACNGSGYRGRLAVHEIIAVDDLVRKMILNNAEMSAIRRYLLDQDMLFLMDDGFFKAAQGKTTLEEIYRVAADDA
ncbi:GspE/PulE family protein [Alkalicoccus chagannorensis]|uniref:GspE/PulE family protein n=1 Tax=Alkalicoccus chagannorensis TaxID=427072 RepID=UPI00040DF10D|nr:GspE/PulE family protein [Alkalicoccus chagannorensis]